MIGVAVLIAAQTLAEVRGGTLAPVIQVAVFVLAVWAFWFAPVIAIAEDGGSSTRSGAGSARRGSRVREPYVRGALRRPDVRRVRRDVRRRDPGAKLDVNPLHGVDATSCC